MHDTKKKGGNAPKKEEKKIAKDKKFETKLKPLIEKLRDEAESSTLSNPNYMSDDADWLKDGSF